MPLDRQFRDAVLAIPNEAWPLTRGLLTMAGYWRSQEWRGKGWFEVNHEAIEAMAAAGELHIHGDKAHKRASLGVSAGAVQGSLLAGAGHRT